MYKIKNLKQNKMFRRVSYVAAAAALIAAVVFSDTIKGYWNELMGKFTKS